MLMLTMEMMRKTLLFVLVIDVVVVVDAVLFVTSSLRHLIFAFFAACTYIINESMNEWNLPNSKASERCA